MPPLPRDTKKLSNSHELVGLRPDCYRRHLPPWNHHQCVYNEDPLLEHQVGMVRKSHWVQSTGPRKGQLHNIISGAQRTVSSPATLLSISAYTLGVTLVSQHGLDVRGFK